MRSIVQILIVLNISCSALAMGGWSSGGGELLKDSRNPWFLNNTKDVSYCIRLDAVQFGTDIPFARKQIQKALSFWQSEFSKAIVPALTEFGPLGIATQKFNEVSCRQHPDMVFQFGVLSKEQKDFLQRPTDFAAISVRTDYNRKTLRGRGFVYVSPEKGPLAYNSQRVVHDAWSRDQGEYLYLTLVHEMGHVFGLPHMGSYGELMSEGFVEALLESKPNDKIISSQSLHFFSLQQETHGFCLQEPALSQWRELFSLSTTDLCFQIRFQHSAASELFASSKVEIWTGETAKGISKIVGQGTLTMTKFSPVLLTSIWLSSDQDLFSSIDLKEDHTHIAGSSLLEVEKNGVFEIAGSGLKRNMSLRLRQGSNFISLEAITENGQFAPLL